MGKKAKAKAAQTVMGTGYLIKKVIGSVTRKIARGLSLLSALSVVVIGVIHLGQEFHKWCDTNNTHVDGCVGPYLIWSDTGHGASDNNVEWRSVFTFRTNFLAELWTPLILGLVGVLVHFKRMAGTFAIVCKNWFRIMILDLIIALFGAFGYVGNLGVITGFAMSFCALLAFLLAIFSPNSECTMGLFG